tara:strand:+ start:524 stop:2491 length:1968 start_codon:yes stop_codon:yes gene_type:complete
MKYTILLATLFLNLNIFSNDLELSDDFIKRFSSLPSYTDAQISPDGTKISVILKINEKRSLAFFNTEDLSLLNVVNLTRKEQIGNYYWANNERVIISIAYEVGSLEVPVGRGELFAVNFDSSKPNYLFGMRKRVSASNKTAVDKFSGAYILDLLEDDPKHILVQASEFAKYSAGAFSTVLRINIYNGQQKSLGKSPLGGASLLTDSSGEPRFAVGVNSKSEFISMFKESDSDEWTQLSKGEIGEGSINPITFMEDDTKVIVLDSTESSTAKIKSLDLVNGTEEVIFHHPKYDPSPVILDDEMIGAVVSSGYYQMYWFENDSDISKIVQQVVSYFNDGNLEKLTKANISVSSISKDRKKAIIQVSDDISSPKYYLYDLNKGSIAFLFAMWPEIDEPGLESTKPFKFKNSDGIEIHGYFTNARNQDQNSLPPLVVLPHGGPIGPSDDWSFDPDVHMLSNAGYAVMKVNYRGSGGYGRDFLRAGLGQAGGDIQDDIIEATEWVIDKGWVDKQRVGIYGGSFGGYSAAMAPMLRPDLFKAGVAYVGVFDLNLNQEVGDVRRMYFGKAQLAQIYGPDEETRAQMSPVNNVSKLEAPLLIVSGEEDQRCPPEQAYALEEELKKHNKVYELIVVKKEGHGFQNPENREMFYKKMLGHFKKHL